jgi:redox-sensing transcriptional repressor
MRNVDKRDVPDVTVPRLALYLRKLRELQARGVERISSKDLAQMIDLNAAQIRKDFSYFGEFGTRGVGYEVGRLVDEITRCLGLHHTWNVVIVGAGLLGTALARYRGFGEQGFRLVGMFDSSDRVVGAKFGTGDESKVRSVGELESFLETQQVDIAMVTVPASEAQTTIDRLVSAGVTAILNFAPVKVHTPGHVLVRQVDLSSELMSLSFYLDRERSEDG